jgi:hypothetical protein
MHGCFVALAPIIVLCWIGMLLVLELHDETYLKNLST